MSYTVEKLLDIARKEIGYIEKETNANLDDKTANAGDNNWTKYARDLHAAGYYQANKNGYAWCDMWVDWLFLQLCGTKAKAEDMICQTGLYGAGCEWSAKYYKQQNRFFSEGKVGDQIFFNDYAHTGIVEKIENGIVTTIEGNTSNKVARRTYEVGSSKIDGYGRPKYDVEEIKQETVAAFKVGDIVNFTGNRHYATANSSSGPSCKGGKAKITNIYQLGKSKHPYHLIRETGSGATVYGWVDEGTFTAYEEKKYYRVRKSWNDEDSQIGAYEDLSVAKTVRDNANPYKIYDWNGNEV